jgi:hypothetical protein
MKNKSIARAKRLFRKIANGQIFLRIFPSWGFLFLQKRYQAYVRNLAAKGLPLIIRIEYGGLGDHLVYSAFPEAIFKKYGVKTQISLKSAFNSPEIKDFVWAANPYVSFSPEKGKLFIINNYKKYKNYNEILFALFGLDGPLFSLPYQPKSRPEVSDKVLCDFTAGPSSAYNAFHRPEFWEAVLNYLKDNFKKEELLLIEPKSQYPDKRLMNYIKEHLEIETIPVGPIAELADLLCSAKGRVLLDSGAKSLAAAYGKPAAVLVGGFVNTYFDYEGNKYIYV